MATWKKLLTEDDGLNLSSADQTIPSSTNRAVLLSYPSSAFQNTLLSIGGCGWFRNAENNTSGRSAERS